MLFEMNMPPDPIVICTLFDLYFDHWKITKGVSNQSAGSFQSYQSSYPISMSGFNMFQPTFAD